MIRKGEILETYRDTFHNSFLTPSYVDLLQLLEWHKKRIEILDRENHRCQKCNLWCIDEDFYGVDPNYGHMNYYAWSGKETSKRHFRDRTTGLARLLTEEEELMFKPQPVKLIPNVHHTYYIFNTLPWNYPNESLMLLCHFCHTEVHKTEQIPVYSDETFQDRIEGTPCHKCDGSGYLEEFDYYKDGVCFGCGGTGIKELAGL